MSTLKSTIKLIVITTFLILGAGVPAFASWWSESPCNMTTLNKTNDKCQELLARKTYEHAQAALKAIPALSPREEDWLRREENSENPDRSIKASTSVEGLRAKMISNLTGIRTASNLLIHPKENNTKANKAFLWTLILANTNNIGGDELYLLKQNNIDTNLDELFGSNCDNNIEKDFNYGDCIDFSKRYFYMRIIINNFLLSEISKMKN